MKGLGGTHATIAEELGLSSRELSRLVGLADGDDSDGSGDYWGDGPGDTDRDDDTDDDGAANHGDDGDTAGTTDTGAGDTDTGGSVQPGQYAGV